MLGSNGVPFFVFDQKYAVSGAQPSELFLSALEQTWAAAHPLMTLAGAGDADTCVDENCLV
jgi:predicted DsbA family dithiol-disulfide isomerase